MSRHSFSHILRWNKRSQEVLRAAMARKSITPEGIVLLLPLRARRDPKELDASLPKLTELLEAFEIRIVRSDTFSGLASVSETKERRTKDEAEGEDGFEEILEEASKGYSEDDLVLIYMREMNRYPLLSAEQAASWGKLARANKDKNAWETLVCANLRLAFVFARKFLNRGLPYLDLIQESNLGLMRAAELWDERKKFRFSTYATWWIKQRCRIAVRDESRFIRLPMNVWQECGRILMAARKLEAELGEKPTPTQIARHARMSVTQVQDRLRLVELRPCSLDDPFIPPDSKRKLFARNESGVPTVGEVTRNASILTPLETAEAKDELHAAYKRLENLVERARQLVGGTWEFIFRLRYGLDGTLEPKVYRSIVERFGFTGEGIRQIDERVLEKLGIRKAYLAEERERILMLEDLVGDEGFTFRKRLAIPPFIFRSRSPPGPRKRRTSS